MSDIGWLAYNARENQQIQDIFRHFLEREARDELGLGEIRDSISDRMFPGTSVLHTRVRYMLFIPWLFKMVENDIKKEEKTTNRIPSVSQIQNRIKTLEVRLIDSLIKGEEESGIIGVNAKHKLKFFPSEVYWSGLKAWEICEEEGPLNNLYYSIYQHFNRDFDPYLELEEDRPKKDKSFWCEKLPPKPKNLLREANFELTKREAKFLKEQLCRVHSDSLLVELIKMGGTYDNDYHYVWQIPGRSKLSNEQRKLIRHGEIFSFVMHGAAILYNLELSKCEWHKDKTSKYEKLLSDWRDEFDDLYGKRVDRWNLDEFWDVIDHENHNIGFDAMDFVENWHEIVNSTKNLATSKKAIKTIKEREIAMKPRNSRFKNSKALKRWKGDAGINRYNYRWNTVREHINDINSAI